MPRLWKRIQMLAAAVVLAGAWSMPASSASPVVAEDGCSQSQWRGCECASDDACRDAYPNEPGCVWGYPIGCSPGENGNAHCDIQCMSSPTSPCGLVYMCG